MFLALDTVSQSVSIAIADAHTTVYRATLQANKTHSKTLMPMIASMLEVTQLSLSSLKGIVVTSGPGSFTGVRIGFSTAKALALGADLPFYSLNALEVLAESIVRKFHVCPLFDARRQEVYTALYSPKNPSGDRKALIEPSAMGIEEIIEEAKKVKGPLYFTGDGLNSYQEILQNTLPKAHFAPTYARSIDAPALCRLATRREAVDLYSAQPTYLRRSEAVVKWEEAHPGETLDGRL